MVVYVYRCPVHGVTEQSSPMGAAAATVPCPTCGLTAARSFTAPRLSVGSPRRRALIDRTERSADQPQVVSGPPSRANRPAPVSGNPALRRLPRP